MVSAKQIQNSYIKLYESLRSYVWPLSIVEGIADLEIAVYKAFPSIEAIQAAFAFLKYMCEQYVKNDDELFSKFDDFEEILNNSETMYAKLNTRTRKDSIDESF